MSRDATPVDPKQARLFDKRTVDRNIKKGLVTRKDYDKYLKTLDDVADKGVYGSADTRGDDEPAPAAPPAAPPSPLDGESR
ncbi:MAG TPA: hypothetical protein VMT03_15400 [Polyangia bacterium]|nr:hypothetical protein [Polyangia bacterium]